MKEKIAHYSIEIYLILYGVLSLLTLTRFPFVHSDEPWLAGLSLEYLKQKSPYVTEPFFDLMPRQPHLLKVLFHSVQALFIGLFDYKIFSVRLVSLIVALCILILFYKVICLQYNNKKNNLLLTILLSLNVQFVYASHFARQEIILGLVFIIGLYLLHSSYTIEKQTLLLGALVGLSFGFHPNAFIIGTMLGAVLVLKLLMGQMPFKGLLLYIGGLSFFTSIYVALSLLGNPTFFKDYWTFGKTLSVDAAPIDRFENFKHFYIKIYEQISGTYYLPNLKVFMLVALLAILFGILVFFLPSAPLKSAAKTRLGEVLSMILGYNVAVFLIGRYNPTSFFFLIIPLFLLFAEIYHRGYSHMKRIWILLLFLLIAFSTVQTTKEVLTYKADAYALYLEEISGHLPHDAVVLGNLSGGFAFESVPYYDIRNLYYLDDMTLEDYIRSRGINTLIYYEAYDYIHRNPEWQILYGADEGYYDALQQLIKKTGTLQYQFESPQYGNRIVRYINDYPWKVWIYTLD